MSKKDGLKFDSAAGTTSVRVTIMGEATPELASVTTPPSSGSPPVDEPDQKERFFGALHELAKGKK